MAQSPSLACVFAAYASAWFILSTKPARYFLRLHPICNYLSFRKASDDDVDTLKNWLLNRALEHDKPTLLFHLACQWLHQHKILRPGITTVEKIVVTARQQAQEETYHQLNVLLTDERREVIDKLLTPIEDSSRTQHFWLRHGAVSNTPDAILNNIEKLQFLYALGVDQWNLSSLNPNRQKFLAAIEGTQTQIS